MSTVLNHGKYAGFTFEEIIRQDLPYCQFMLTLKFVKPHFKEFIDFLKVNVPFYESAALQKRVDNIRI